MNEKQKQHAADLLMSSGFIVGSDHLLPKIYVVNGDCYWFLNAARRAAYGTSHDIEVVTIEEAMRMNGINPLLVRRSRILQNFDQLGETYYDGRLYNSLSSVQASAVRNRVIGEEVPEDTPSMVMMDQSIEWQKLPARVAHAIHARKDIQTYRDLIRYGRNGILQLRNMGETSIVSLDNHMEDVGFGKIWM